MHRLLYAWLYAQAKSKLTLLHAAVAHHSADQVGELPDPLRGERRHDRQELSLPVHQQLFRAKQPRSLHHHDSACSRRLQLLRLVQVLFYIAYMRPFAMQTDLYASIAGVVPDDPSSGSGGFDLLGLNPLGKSDGGAERLSGKSSSLPELQFQLIIVFTGKTLGKTALQHIKPKIMYFIKESLIIMKLKKRLEAEEEFEQKAEEQASVGAPGDVSPTRDPRLEELESGMGSATFDTDSPNSASPKVKQHKTHAQLREELRLSAQDEHMVEDEYLMEPFESTFDEFNEMVIQYGYLALFAPAYSLAPLCALINNVFEIRIDAVKFCTFLRRPQWRPCEDIGSWYAVMNVLGFAAVITNCSMIAFVGTQLATNEFERVGIGNRLTVQRLWTVTVGLEHALMLLRVVVMKQQPETPEWLEDCRDTLSYRIRRFKTMARVMAEDGASMAEIHHNLWLDEQEQTRVRQEKWDLVKAKNEELKNQTFLEKGLHVVTDAIEDVGDIVHDVGTAVLQEFDSNSDDDDDANPQMEQTQDYSDAKSGSEDDLT